MTTLDIEIDIMGQEAQFWATTAIAIYGAILASVLAILEIKRRQPRIRVKASLGVLWSDDGKPSEPFIIIEAVNLGQGPVTFDNFGWLNRDGSKQVILKPYLLEFPFTLDERKRCNAYYACRWFQENEENRQISAAFFQDQTGTIWTTKISSKQRRLWLAAKKMGHLLMWNQELRAYYWVKPDQTAERA